MIICTAIDEEAPEEVFILDADLFSLTTWYGSLILAKHKVPVRELNFTMNKAVCEEIAAKLRERFDEILDEDVYYDMEAPHEYEQEIKTKFKAWLSFLETCGGLVAKNVDKGLDTPAP